MVTDNDRNWFRFQKTRLDDARKRLDANLYHQIYNSMLSAANKIIVDQQWWEIWSSSEASEILMSVLAIPPFIAGPESATERQIQEDLAIHRKIDKSLDEHVRSLETTKLVVEIVDYTASAVGAAVGVGSAGMAIKELIKRFGARKAGEILAKEYFKSRIREEIQDKALEGLAQAMGADPAMASMAKELVETVRNARKSKSRVPEAPQIPKAPVAPLPPHSGRFSESRLQELRNVSRTINKAPRVVDAKPAVPLPAQTVTLPERKDMPWRKSFKQEFEQIHGELGSGMDRRHMIPDKWARDKLLKQLNDAPDLKTQCQILRDLGYDPTHYGMDMQKAARKYFADWTNDPRRVFPGPAGPNRSLQDKGLDMPPWWHAPQRSLELAGNDRAAKHRILKAAGFDPDRYGGDVEAAAHAWQLEIAERWVAQFGK